MNGEDRLLEQGSQHYLNLKLQPWEVMEKWGHPIEFFGFLKFCALKRIGRLEEKNEIEKDLTKSIHELQKMLQWYQDNQKAIDEVLGLAIQPAELVIRDWEWATEQMRNGHRVKRAEWSDTRGIMVYSAMGVPNIYTDMQSRVYNGSLEDLVAEDWEIVA